MAEEVGKTKLNGVKKYKDFIFAVGRRRSAVARVRVYPKTSDSLKFGEFMVKKGDVVVNSKLISEYFTGVVAKSAYEKPFKVTDTLNKYSVTVRVEGGGTNSQLGAFTLGVSRALCAIDESLKPTLRKNGLLTRDPRVRERRKVGMGGKSRRQKQSPKR
jgi:small subunit ribosomal protein S9